jgi:hypothetical protein
MTGRSLKNIASNYEINEIDRGIYQEIINNTQKHMSI